MHFYSENTNLITITEFSIALALAELLRVAVIMDDAAVIQLA